jgi:hypothetical protein
VDFELLDASGGLTGFLCRIHSRRQVVVLLDVTHCYLVVAKKS